MKTLFDTSSFAKRYIEEEGTEKVIHICNKTSELVLSSLCIPEFISVISRLKREKKLTKANYEKIKSTFLLEISDATIIHINHDVILKSVELIEKHPLRTLDAIHTACALVSQPDNFISSDKRQIEAAKKEGLKVTAV